MRIWLTAWKPKKPLMRWMSSPCAWVRNRARAPSQAIGQHTGLVTAIFARTAAFCPGDLFRPRAFGEILTGDFVPGAEQRGIDSRTLRQNGIDDTIGQLGNLFFAFFGDNSLDCGPGTVFAHPRP